MMELMRTYGPDCLVRRDATMGPYDHPPGGSVEH